MQALHIPPQSPSRMQEPRILDRLHQQYSGKRVRDVHMVLEGTARDSTLLYVPGYLFDYMYGEVKDDSLEITKQHHQALVPAAGASIPDSHPAFPNRMHMLPHDSKKYDRWSRLCLANASRRP